MANVLVQDGAGVSKYLKATGDGSNGDPFVVQHLMGSGATDDAAAAGELYPIAGLYQATVDEVDAGDVGRVRMSRRRSQIIASDHKIVTLSAAAPVPSDSDIVNQAGGALVAGDFDIRDTNNHYFYIPMAERSWKNLGILMRSSSAFDQAATVRLIMGIGGSSITYGLLGELTMPASSVGVSFVPSGGLGASMGEVVGASTMVTGAVYAVPAFRDVSASGIFIRVSFAVAPTTGTLVLYISRGG
jgi:hypothetical protein